MSARVSSSVAHASALGSASPIRRVITGQYGQLARAGVTERELEVLSAIAERLRNREIAERLHVSVRTVESHRGPAAQARRHRPGGAGRVRH
ncbi:LuxR C-terminal-related transcriptional regulator [Kribbella antiqua]|uniref:response regulator transcription factor n=1 Tax=Kribbella antiqua TaxID=2512217 RepID=UPI001051421C